MSLECVLQLIGLIITFIFGMLGLTVELIKINKRHQSNRCNSSFTVHYTYISIDLFCGSGGIYSENFEYESDKVTQSQFEKI